MSSYVDLVPAMRGHADAVEARVTDIKKTVLSDVLRFYAQAKEEYDEIDEERKRVYAALEQLSRVTIPEMMAEEGVKTMTLDDIGKRFTVSQRFSASILNKDVGYQWLRDNGLGPLIVETVNSQTLSSALKKRIEEEGIDAPEDVFKTSYMTVTSMTTVK